MAGPLDKLIVDLGRMPADLQRQLRPALRRAGAPILADARRRASWSTRIPGATRLTTSFAGRGAGLRLVTLAKLAPHGRPLNGGSARNRDTNRHPVFQRPGVEVVRVNQPIRPFFEDALDAGRPGVITAAAEAIDAAARANGYR